MTKREILRRMQLAADLTTGEGHQFVVSGVYHDLLSDLAADVRADDGPEPIHTFAHARRRACRIMNGLPNSATTDEARRELSRLCDDLTDTIDRVAARAVEPEPDDDDPTSVSVTVPGGFRVVVERVDGK